MSIGSAANLLFITSAAIALPQGLGDSGKTDMENCQGTWLIVAIQRGGRSLPLDGIKMTVTFKDDKLTQMVNGRAALQGSFILDAKNTPKHLDLYESAGPDKSRPTMMIYALDGDSLKIASYRGEQILTKRPAGFPNGADKELEMLELKRIGLSQSPVAQSLAPAGFDKPRDQVEKGRIASVDYDSNSLGTKRKVVVYAPPGHPQKNRKYPVFYLLHGGGGNEKTWQTSGAADTILDNLYANKKLMPMFVVMPFGFTGPKNGQLGNGDFDTDLLNDIIPFVDAHYPVLADREHRAIAGYSMGADQSLRIALKNLDKFAYIGGFSSDGDTMKGDVTADALRANRPVRLLWLSCGDTDGLLMANLGLHAIWNEKRIDHVWHIGVGGHEWQVWKNDLYQFSQRLFREK